MLEKIKKKINKRTTMKNKNRSAALRRPAMKILGGGGGGGGGGLQLVCVDQPSPLALLWFLRYLAVWYVWKIASL